MIRRVLAIAGAPFVALVGFRPVTDRIARQLMDAPRRAPEEAGMAAALDRLGGEVVRLRARDGLRLTGRWLAAEPDPGWEHDPREAILLLHGWSGSATPDLVELGPFLRRTAGVLGLDFRGHGGSDEAPTTFGVQEVEDVAGALAWMGERGIRRVALAGSSMGGIVAIAAVAILGDGRLAAADTDLDAPASTVEAPRPRIVGVVADSVPPDLATVVANRLRVPFGRRIADRAWSRVAALAGGDPRLTQPVAVVGLLEDLPLLIVHGERDATVRPRDVRRLAAKAPGGTRAVTIAGADHGGGHAADPDAYEAAVTGLLRDAFRAARG